MKRCSGSLLFLILFATGCQKTMVRRVAPQPEPPPAITADDDRDEAKGAMEWFLMRRVAPTSSGFLEVYAYSTRLDVTGNAGLVVALYDGAPTKEVACTMIPRDTSGEVDSIFS